MIYIYGDVENEDLERIRKTGRPACAILSPKRPTKASIAQHATDGAANTGWWVVAEMDNGGIRIVASG